MIKLKRALRLLILVSLTQFFGCAGGGSIGTGGERIGGTLFTNDGQPLQQVFVTLEGTTLQDLTDSSGQFNLEVDQIPPQFQLRFESALVRDTISITDLPEEANSVEITARVDTRSGKVSVDRVDVRRDQDREDEEPAEDDEREEEEDEEDELDDPASPGEDENNQDTPDEIDEGGEEEEENDDDPVQENPEEPDPEEEDPEETAEEDDPEQDE